MSGNSRPFPSHPTGHTQCHWGLRCHLFCPCVHPVQNGNSRAVIQNTDILTSDAVRHPVRHASSALATLVGAPRIIQAVAMDESIPMAGWLQERASDGEPRNATFLTAGIALLALSLRDLNAIAPLITICFLCTYAMINGVVVIEQGLGLVNFRPRIRIQLFVPDIGFIGSVVAMLVIKPALSLGTLGLMILIYDWMSRQEKADDQADVRTNLCGIGTMGSHTSGLFASL